MLQRRCTGRHYSGVGTAGLRFDRQRMTLLERLSTDARLLSFPITTMALPSRLVSRAAPLCALLIALPASTPLFAQATQPPVSSSTAAAPKPAAAAPLSVAELLSLAQAQIAIAAILDSSGAELAQVKNKTLQAQVEMQKRRGQLVAAVLSKSGMTDEQYNARRYAVSIDGRMRFQLDSMVAKLTGQGIPGVFVAPVVAPVVVLPAGIVGIEIGYVAVGYLDTPGKAGLLAMAQTEAKVAAQHAGFMARALDNLQTLQMHSGHVLHAVDPQSMPAATAPGKNYGLKRSLDGIIAYADAASKDVGASANVKAHTVHIITAAKSTLLRADQVMALARKIQAATTPAAAATLAGQLQSLCDQLLAGSDLNHDGRIVWGDGEGGLQQIQDHLNLLLAAEKKP